MSDISTDRVIDVLERAAKALELAGRKTRLPLDKTLWTREQVGEYLEADSRTTLDRYMSAPGFPKAKAIGHGRWNAQEVIDWAGEQ